MPRTPDPLPNGLPTVFSSAEARAAGVSSRRLRQLDVERLGYELYRRRIDDGTAGTGVQPAHPAEESRRRVLDRALAIGPRLPPGHFFAGTTAAVIWRLPCPTPSGEIQVACFSPNRPNRRGGTSARNVQPALANVVTHLGVRLTDPASTWAMLAPSLELRDGVALGDAVIRRHRIPGTTRVQLRPLATVAELEAVVTAGRRVGVGRLRELLPLLSAQSASAPESHLRMLLRGWNFPAPNLDFDVRGVDGELLGCSEFAFPEWKLVLEYEGGQHRTETAQWNRDIEKYRHYAQVGWEVIRVTADLLYRRPEELRRQLSEALTRRDWRPA